MANLRFAMFGTGFWSRFQLAGWIEAGGVECVALYNRTVSKAEKLAAEFGIPQENVFGSTEKLLDTVPDLDFVDICTAVELHAPMTKQVADRGIDVVCQKPMAVTLEEGEEMLRYCQDKEVKFIVNENFRWQTPIRTFKKQMDTGRIGQPFRANLHFVTSFPVFDNQPFLKELEQFMLTDVGSHILDVARFLFGEAKTLYCRTQRIHSDIKGEDVATVVMTMGDTEGPTGGVTVSCEMSYASRTEIERFPETYIYVEGDKGFLELGPDFWIRETTEDGTLSRRYPPPRYPWADPAYDIVHSSIVPAQVDIAAALRGDKDAETDGTDNINTVRLVFGSYESATTQQVIVPRLD